MTAELENLEAYADLIIKEIATPEELAQAETDVKHSSAAAWRSVRLSLKWQAETDGELPKTAVRIAVGRLYHVSDETIRRREKAGELVTDAMIDAYPLLSFSYWRTACDAHHLPDQTPLENLMDIIYQIMEYHAAFGKLPSVAMVEGWVYGESGKLPWLSRLEGVTGTLDKIIHDKYAAEDGKAVASLCKTWILNYLSGDGHLIVPPRPLDFEKKGGKAG